tara:strand:+ start:86 stop:2701 length:2616 start_codon:yes stop_codon:yes gene_type:complete
MVIFIEKNMELRLKYADFETKINFKEFTKNFFDFSFGSLITEAINIESTNESIAFSLLFNTTKTTFANESQRLGQDELNKSTNLIVLSNLFEIDIKELYEQEVIITEDFFNDVIKNNKKYLNLSYKIFKKFIKELKIEEPDCYFLDFVLSFQDELLKEYNTYEKYQKLGKLFNSPLIEENKKLKSLISNYKEYKSYYTQKLQENSDENNETLSDLYINPFFTIFTNNLTDNKGNYGEFETIKNKINIHNYVSKYFLVNKKPNYIRENSNMLFILGQPGQGKTSLCYRLIYDFTVNNQFPETPLIFLKIRDLPSQGFLHATFRTINKFSKLNFDIDFYKDNCILILDGLDEAYMTGGLKDTDLSNLYDRLNKTAKANKNLKIIITSRLNYLNLSNSCVDGSLVFQLEGLTNKQINYYSVKFDKFYPEYNFIDKIKNILPKKNDSSDNPIIELLRQTVLLYFIGISKIELSKDDSRIKVYSKLFETISRRSWDSNGQLSYFNKNLKNSPKKYNGYLRKYIRSIAFEIYQSDNLYITVDELIALESSKTFIRKSFDSSISIDQEFVKDINKYLLISFYFQNTKGNDKNAIEFFHNSLWEFLTAEYIWEEFKDLVLQTDEDGDLNPIKLFDFYSFLEGIIGNKKLNYQIGHNLEEIINSENKNNLKLINSQITTPFHKLADKNFLLLYDYRTEKLNSYEKLYSIFRLSWLILKQINISLKEEHIYVNENLCNYIFNSESTLPFHMNLSNLYYTKDSFIHSTSILTCDLSNSIFFETSFYNCIIDDNNLSKSKFESCNIQEIKFSYNNFEEITLIKCIISNSTFNNNNFSNFIFEEVVVYEKDWLELFLKNNIVDKNLDDFIISKAKGETYYISTK